MNFNKFLPTNKIIKVSLGLILIFETTNLRREQKQFDLLIKERINCQKKNETEISGLRCQRDFENFNFKNKLFFKMGVGKTLDVQITASFNIVYKI